MAVKVESSYNFFLQKMRCQKTRHGHNFEFSDPPIKSIVDNPVFSCPKFGEGGSSRSQGLKGCSLCSQIKSGSLSESVTRSPIELSVEKDKKTQRKRTKRVPCCDVRAVSQCDAICVFYDVKLRWFHVSKALPHDPLPYNSCGNEKLDVFDIDVL